MRSINKYATILLLIFSAGSLMDCATTHRGPRTLDPGQLSASASYLRLKMADADAESDPGELIAIEGRVGLMRGLDIGFMRSFDITEGVESENGMDSYLLDTKVQLLNRDNIMNRPTLSLGYGLGKWANEEEIWVNTLYLLLGVQSNKATFFYSFRYENLDDELNFSPAWVVDASFDELNKAHVLGIEYAINQSIKPVMEIGRYYIDDYADGMNMITAGINLYMN